MTDPKAFDPFDERHYDDAVLTEDSGLSDAYRESIMPATIRALRDARTPRPAAAKASDRKNRGLGRAPGPASAQK